MMADHRSQFQSSIIAFRAPKDLVAATKAAAASEGISKSDIARRALLRDLGLAKRPTQPEQQSERRA
jgi:hypothetical protein